MLVGLLSHDNSDIAISVINVINELLGEETMAEDEEALALINALVDDLLFSLFYNSLLTATLLPIVDLLFDFICPRTRC